MKKVPVLFFLLAFNVYVASAQTFTENPKSKVAVLHVDTKGLTLDPVQAGDLMRLELDKLGLFEVMDRYDVAYIIEKEALKIENCYGKICLVETGRSLKVDKMLTGTIELIGDNIIVSIRLIDIGKQEVEKSQVIQYLNLRNQLPLMVATTLQKMFALPFDTDVETKLTKPNDYENAINVPETGRLNLSGPRMGTTIFSGENTQIIRSPRSQGGLDAEPIMFQFGYQFETAYLNQGGLQALFEFIPVITGLDQGLFIPSVSVLHGIRSNRNGLEFAFGPVVSASQRAEGFFDDAGKWNNLSVWKTNNPDQNPPAETTIRLDSRGDYALNSNFVFAAGKSFKSGRMNIPVNVFYIPGRGGARFGVSVGFNGRG